MPAATFDFTNLIVDLPTPTGGFLSLDVQEDMYSDWKVALKAVGNIAPPAFDTTAGDPLVAGQDLTGTYFLRNDLGWRIRPTDEDQEVTFVGNLYARDATITKFLNRAGRTVSYEFLLTANPRQVASGSGLSAVQDVKLDEVWAEHNLDSARPVVRDEKGNVNFTGVDVNAETTGVTPDRVTTQTRQP